jgi:methionyl-tRNA formyltransferase
MGIIFIGSQQIGHDCLKEVINLGIKVDAVFTFKPDPHEIWEKNVDIVAKENHIPIFFPNDLTVEKIKRINPDMILVVGYRKIFPKEILSIPKYGVIGLHASLLPHLRGQAPLNWAIINGDSETGITMFKMDDGIDTGDIIGQKHTKIETNMTIDDLKEIIQRLAVELISEFVPLILSGKAVMSKQPPEGTYGCARIPDDSRINWNDKTVKIYNLIRGCEKTYAAFTIFNNRKLYIKKVELVSDGKKYFGTPGQVGMINRDGSVLVITGDGVLKILRVSLEDKNEVDAKMILNSTKIRL